MAGRFEIAQLRTPGGGKPVRERNLFVESAEDEEDAYRQACQSISMFARVPREDLLIKRLGEPLEFPKPKPSAAPESTSAKPADPVSPHTPAVPADSVSVTSPEPPDSSGAGELEALGIEAETAKALRSAGLSTAAQIVAYAQQRGTLTQIPGIGPGRERAIRLAVKAARQE